MNVLRSVLLVVLRVAVGAAMVMAGVDTFSAGLGASVADSAWPVAQVLVPAVALIQLFGGGALALGLFTRFLGVAFAVVMGASLYFDGFAGQTLAVLVAGVVLAVLGGGRFSLDRLFFKRGEFGQYPFWADQMVQMSNAHVNSYTKYRTWGRKSYHAGRDE